MRILFGLLLVLPPSAVDAQWTEFRLTSDPDTSRTEIDGGRNVTISDDLLATVWSDDRSGNFEIWFRERVLGTWNDSVRLTTNPARSTHPAIGRFPGEMRAVWQDERTGHPEVWMKRKLFGVWGPDSCVTCDAFESARPSLDHTGEHLVWEDTKDGNREIYHRRRTPNGTWEPETRVSNDPGESGHPTVNTPDLVSFSLGAAPLVIVAWQDDRDGNLEIYSRLWDDVNLWGPETRVTDDSGASRHPSAIVAWDSCSDVGFPWHALVWQDDRNGNEDVFYAEGAFGQWPVSGAFTATPTPSVNPSVTTARYHVPGPFGGVVLCQFPAIGWVERTGSGTGTIFVDAGNGSGAEIVSTAGADPWNLSLAVQHTLPAGEDGFRTLEVVWTDRRDGNEEIYEASLVELLSVTSAPEITPGSALSLEPARPNPFREEVSFAVALEMRSGLEVRVVDAAGRSVRDLFRGERPAGRHPFVWDGRTNGGARVASGVYFVGVRTSSAMRSARLVLRR